MLTPTLRFRSVSVRRSRNLFIVALMTDLLNLNANDAVLEIGTGFGYQAAILGELARKVYSVEIIAELARQAEQRLGRLSYTNIEFKVGNGYYGWPEYAPFDKVIVTAAPELIPPPLIQQLKPDGRMVIPAGLPEAQQLILVTKQRDGKLTITEILPVRFSTLEEGESSGSGGSSSLIGSRAHEATKRPQSSINRGREASPWMKSSPMFLPGHGSPNPMGTISTAI